MQTHHLAISSGLVSFIASNADALSLNAELARLRAENERLKADAARYRWMRDIGDSTYAPLAERVKSGAAGIDARIDAAMAQGKV